jgi:malonyl-CoA O-methyltransferase
MDFKARLTHQFNRAAFTYDAAALLQLETAGRLAGYLSQNGPLQRVLDLGCGTGFGLQFLKQRYPHSEWIGLDVSECMLWKAQEKEPEAVYLNADFDTLPLSDGSVDLVFSNLALQWSPSLSRSLDEIRRVLKEKRTLLFSTLVGQSMQELGQTPFLSCEAVQQSVKQSRFEILDQRLEQRRLEFPSVWEVLQSLKKVGAVACQTQTTTHLNGWRALQELADAYPRTQSGTYPLSYELLYLHSRKQR